MIAGVVTAFSFSAFLSVCAWAWSRRNRARFEQAAQLPLSDEPEMRS